MGEEYTRFWFAAREVRFRAELLKLVSFARTKRAGLHSDPLDDLVLLVFEQVSRHVRAHVAISAQSRRISRRHRAGGPLPAAVARGPPARLTRGNLARRRRAHAAPRPRAEGAPSQVHNHHMCMHISPRSRPDPGAISRVSRRASRARPTYTTSSTPSICSEMRLSSGRRCDSRAGADADDTSYMCGGVGRGQAAGRGSLRAARGRRALRPERNGVTAYRPLALTPTSDVRCVYIKVVYS